MQQNLNMLLEITTAPFSTETAYDPAVMIGLKFSCSLSIPFAICKLFPTAKFPFTFVSFNIFSYIIRQEFWNFLALSKVVKKCLTLGRLYFC